MKGNPIRIHGFFRSVLILLALCACAGEGIAQGNATLRGTIYDKITGYPIENISIAARGTVYAVYSNEKGQYELSIPPGNYTIDFKSLGYFTKTITRAFSSGLQEALDLRLEPSVRSLGGIRIEDQQTRASTLTRLDPNLVSQLPTSGGIESLIKTLPGVSSNNELSSQYNVRGGNFDENLIYVNDIEIYRPFLVRSGQQEGLSFINPDLVSSVLFSAGGFDARFGDKMASVLDIQYRRPRNFQGTATASLLGAALHLEGMSKDSRFTYLMGFRQRSNQYLLNSLDTKSDYKPLFLDGQVLLNYDFTPEYSMQWLGNYARNKYQEVPGVRQTVFGTVNQALRLNVYFDGQELNDFETYLTALSGIYKRDDGLMLKWIASGFRSYEFETYDVIGQYFLDELENDFGKETFGDVKFNRGIGGYHNHARNYLIATVLNLELKGAYKNWMWGARTQNEIIEDELSEWKALDSAGFVIPYGNPSVLDLTQTLKQTIALNTQRSMAYLQYNLVWGEKTEYRLTAGIRGNYWNLNNQFLTSPRATLAIKPDWKKDWLFRFSSGIYYQPPFYRELRNLNGQINTSLRAQQSIHFVAGADYNLNIWKRPFKLTIESYYKQLNDLIPYEIDNVRIRYYAENIARGYATGIDTRLYGEFVNGIESWFSLSVMKTAENLVNDSYRVLYNSEGEVIIPGFTANNAPADTVVIDPGFIRRPSDQRVNFSIFFQDYLPKLPRCKMNLTLLFGSGMPFGPPSFERYKDTLKMPPYRRVDIGLSYDLLTEKDQENRKGFWKGVRGLWFGIDVFNLLQINNTISYLWIKDVTNREYAIPNYLTNRQVNVKMVVRF